MINISKVGSGKTPQLKYENRKNILNTAGAHNFFLICYRQIIVHFYLERALRVHQVVTTRSDVYFYIEVKLSNKSL